MEELTDVLRGGRQCDEEGVEIIMSRQACLEAADEIERLQAEIAECAAALPGPLYMDPPDGGDVLVSEQLRRMAEDAKRYLFLCRQIYRNETGHLDLGGEIACNWHDPNGGEIDRAIDAAMKTYNSGINRSREAASG